MTTVKQNMSRKLIQEARMVEKNIIVCLSMEFKCRRTVYENNKERRTAAPI